MTIKINGRKIEVTEGLKSYIEKKISKLDKYFGETALANVTISVQKDHHIVEVTIFQDSMIYRAEVSNDDMYAAIDKVEDVLERQIRKQKTRLEKRLKGDAFVDEPVPEFAEEVEFKIVKKKVYTAKPMSVEEAILQMNLLGHNFYIFSNSETEDKNVVYKRKDGNYGVIELN